MHLASPDPAGPSEGTSGARGARLEAGTVEAVLLDAGNTLLFVDPRRVLPLVREIGRVDAGPEDFAAAERSARRRLAAMVEEGHRGTEPDLWADYFRTLLRECGVQEGRVEAVGEWIVREHDERHLWSRVERGTVRALEALRDAEYRLAVISNADGRVEALLEETGLRPHFEFVIDSDVVGVEKPDPRIFRMAVERLELEPGRCLYVGDLHPVDVVGARAAGLRAVLLDPFDVVMEAPVDRIASVRDLPDYLGVPGNGAG